MEKMHETKAQDYPPEKYCNSNWLVEEKFVIEVLKKCDAIWEHNGDPKKPHIQLQTCLCSGGFFNCYKALKYINLNEIFAYHLAIKIRKEIGDLSVDWVIGSPMSGITFSYAVARYLGAGIQMFPEEDRSSGDMIWKREVIPEGDSVLQIEELIATPKKFSDTRWAIRRDNPYLVNWIPVIGVFVHTPHKLPLTHYGDRKVISLFEKEIRTSEMSCDLCDAGSPPLYNPSRHWRELIGK